VTNSPKNSGTFFLIKKHDSFPKRGITCRNSNQTNFFDNINPSPELNWPYNLFKRTKTALILNIRVNFGKLINHKPKSLNDLDLGGSMKTFTQALKRQEGFTLVELMVVVAIIGLLSAVAIPNFKKYQAKSKTSEAKLQLAAIYTAEQSWFSDYDNYASCLQQMGYDPHPEVQSRYYAIGFPAATYSTNSNSVNNGAPPACIDATTVTLHNAAGLSASSAGGFAAWKQINAYRAAAGDFTNDNIFAATLVAAVTTTEVTGGSGSESARFRAAAMGPIDSGFTTATTVSSWSIDQNKKLLQIRQGY
jgi:type IV pilus assembly protein PilA